MWRASMDLVGDVYRLCGVFTPEERFGLSAQIKRAAVSIPSNIAEGSRRGSKKDYHHFLLIFFGSGSELETQIEVSKNLPFGKKLDFTLIDSLLDEVMKMLNSLVNKLGR